MRRILLFLILGAMPAPISSASGHAVFPIVSFGDGKSVSLSLAEERSSGNLTVAQRAADGAELFEKRCSQCHASAARVLRRLPREPATRREALSSLFANHHTPDEAERAVVIDWLVAQ
ncbi:hypothetical protein [Neorhizobium sp. LjRoot104]|uniref:hypothetical protein n=1 Tax=Neorhizobium sp. LjRoot104 TaxID=3342254 RepID=UPI003ECFF74F